MGSVAAMGLDVRLESFCREDFSIQRSSVQPPQLAPLWDWECGSCCAGSFYVWFCVGKFGLGFPGVWKPASRLAFGGRGSPEAVRVLGQHSCPGLPTLARCSPALMVLQLAGRCVPGWKREKVAFKFWKRAQHALTPTCMGLRCGNQSCATALTRVSIWFFIGSLRFVFMVGQSMSWMGSTSLTSQSKTHSLDCPVKLHILLRCFNYENYR